jgi:cell division protein FtsB
MSFICHYREGITVRNTVLATAVAATLALAAPEAFAQARGAASKAEVQAIEAQMKALANRLSKLESANAALQTQNSELQSVVERRDAEIDYLKSQTKELREEGAVAANEISKVKGADWATRIKGRGDFRYRQENIWQQRVNGTGPTAQVDDAANRSRQRIRARLGFDAQVTDHVKTTLLLATGGTDPRSSNQTLGEQNQRKTVGVDMAFADWNFMQGANLILGKQPWPFWRPGQSLFYDGDYNPEGGAVKFERGMLFGSAYGWWLSEQWNANPKGENSDGNVFGAQLGLKFPLFGGETRVAAHYYDCGACQDQTSILFANNGNGNTTYPVLVTSTIGRTTGNPPVNVVSTTTQNYLRYDYNIIELQGEVGLTLFNLPFSVWANWAQNMADDIQYDTAYAVGAQLGRASNPKTWNAAVWYQSLDKDALFAQFVDSDFGDGRTDSDGWVFRGAYAPVRNFNIQATYFLNSINKDVAPVSGPGYEVGKGLDYDRLQVDLNYRF